MHINLIIIIIEEFPELLQCAKHWVRHWTLWYCNYWSRYSYEESTTIGIVILSMGRFRLWKVKKIIQYPKSSEWQSRDLNPGQCDSNPTVIILMFADLERETWWRALSKQGFPRDWRYPLLFCCMFWLKSVGKPWWCSGIGSMCKPFWKKKCRTVQLVGQIPVSHLLLWSLKPVSFLLQTSLLTTSNGEQLKEEEWGNQWAGFP